MTIVTGQETQAQMLVKAYGLEAGLAGFYRALAQEIADAETADLLILLAAIEDKHKKAVRELFTQASPIEADRAAMEEAETNQGIEGGFTTEGLKESFPPDQLEPEDVLDLAMMIEAQAMDLYLRMSQAAQDPDSAAQLRKISAEENAHLASLARLREERA